jgi:uncharacterized membrane protein
MRTAAWIFRPFRAIGPYLAIELFLPGGSIVALLLWTYRRRLAAAPNRDASRMTEGVVEGAGLLNRVLLAAKSACKQALLRVSLPSVCAKPQGVR